MRSLKRNVARYYMRRLGIQKVNTRMAVSAQGRPQNWRLYLVEALAYYKRIGKRPTSKRTTA